jgi:hypothetical protein
MNELDLVNLMDPDWRDHFREVGEAAEFYRTYAPTEWAEAVKECNGG